MSHELGHRKLPTGSDVAILFLLAEKLATAATSTWSRGCLTPSASPRGPQTDRPKPAPAPCSLTPPAAWPFKPCRRGRLARYGLGAGQPGLPGASEQ